LSGSHPAKEFKLNLNIAGYHDGKKENAPS
jgi:hypothetical protein